MTLLVAVLVAVAATPLVMVAAHRWALLDEPNHRSSHVVPIPRGGGLAVAVAAVAALVATERTSEVIGLAVGASIVGAVGLADDRFGLPAVPRLIAQLVVPVMVGAVVIDRSGARLVLALVVAAFVVAAYINAFNFMDGINGISGSQAAIAGAFLAAIGDHIDAPAVTAAGLAVCGASLGFLPFNAIRARIFLGDVGSYFLGFWLAGLALLVVDAGVAAAVVAGPFLLYLMDTSVVIVRRARRGDRLTEAHREHAYQRLTQAGWSHLAVASLCAVVSGLCALIMYALIDSAVGFQVVGLGVCAVVVIGYLALPGLLERRGNSVRP
jgi:UDP-N-acetylmuramyl pentapeptide phosphotransferase/UDP-N-acetylglucosamine-1-phosphate transferase